MPYTVQLVRSENIAWHGLREALVRERRGEFRLLPDVDDAPAALAAVATTCPDVVLTRVPVPGMALASFIAALRQVCPRVRIVVLLEDPALLTGKELSGLPTSEVVGALLWSDITTRSIDRWLRTVMAGMNVHSSAIPSAILAARSKHQDTENSAPLRLLLADPNALARAGLKALLDADPRFRVVGSVGRDIVAAARRLQPPLLVADRHGKDSWTGKWSATCAGRFPPAGSASTPRSLSHAPSWRP
jgi:DNA-binding NarL/FixJ family response regulator